MTLYRLNAVEILHGTAREIGLESHLDAGLEQRFYHLIELFNEFGSIDEIAYPAAVDEVKRLVGIRLKLARDWDQHPEILEQKIAQPFFIIGNARAGTTLAQALLTLDEGHRTPCYWDVRNPTPPPGMDAESDAFAMDEGARFSKFMLARSPGMLQAHPYLDQGGRAEAEDEFLYAIDFHLAYPLHFLKVPTLPQALAPEDSVLAMEFHKKVWQQLQWKMPTRRWVGKGVIHQYIMSTVLQIYPDSVCFWVHRAPEDYIVSLLELLELQYKPFNGHLYRVDPDEIVNQLKAGTEHFLASDTTFDPRVHHIRFPDLISDPVKVIGDIYDKSGVAFTSDYERKLADWQNDPNKQANRYGKFTYSADKFGLSREGLRKKFIDYCDRFDL